MKVYISKRCRWQYGLQTLFVITLVVSIACSWLAVKLQQARRQHEAVKALVGIADIVYDYESNSGQKKYGADPPGPSWLRNLFGDDFFRTVVSIKISGDITPANLPQLKSLGSVEYLRLGDGGATDAGLEYLKGLRALKELYFFGDKRKITDDWLRQLEGMSQLQVLCLDGTAVSDDGLEVLRGLSQLRRLYLSSTNVTDAGLVHIGHLNQLST